MNLKAQRAAALKAAQDIVKKAQAEGRDLSADEQQTLASKTSEIEDLDRKIKSADLVSRIGALPGTDTGSSSGASTKSAWARDVASRITEVVGDHGVKAITTGGIDIPQVISPAVTTPALKPNRLLELLTTKTLDGNEFEYLRQTVRTNNAAVVADNATKPTSVYTFEEASGRARVIAHLSEPFPIRYLSDHDEVTNILGSQMAEDMYRILESEILAGSGSGEHFTGLDSTSGVQTQAFSTDVLTTLRKARTALVTAAEEPTAWVMNYADLEAIDLLRESGATGAFMAGIDDKIFGNLPRIASSVVPAGTAWLADWRMATVFVRDQGRMDADVSGTLFDKNQIKLRYEGRFGFAVQRPAAFIKVTLTGA